MNPFTEIAGLQVRENVGLASYTTWGVGGPARWLVEPTARQLPDVIRTAAEAGLRTYTIGRGSNILIADAGLNGVVILTRNSIGSISREGNRIIAESGVSLPRLSKFAAAQGFSGYEFLVGIPGTVGGGLAMNAGLTVYSPREIQEVVDWIDIVDVNGCEDRVLYNSLSPEYRSSGILERGLIVLRASFKLEYEEDPHLLHKRTLAHLAERKKKQPLDKKTAGSTFKSRPGGKSAGFYIETAGLKGACVGGAQISGKHANWIENRGDATAKDIQELIAHAIEKVNEECGVMLEPEVQFLS